MQFLWGEEKTKQFYKRQLIINCVGNVIALIFALLLGRDHPYFTAMLLIPILFGIFCIFFLLRIEKPHQRESFLALFLIEQTFIAAFMALTGGFSSIAQFAPYIILVLVVIQLGQTPALILGMYSLLTFVAIYAWELWVGAQTGNFQNFFFYVAIYIVVMLVYFNVGEEISLQLEAKKRLEQVDDLKNQFIALSSHYLLTPLTIIKGYMYQLEKAGTKEQQEQQLDRIKVSVRDMETLIEKFLTIATIERGHANLLLLPTDLVQMLGTIVDSFSSTAKIKRVTLEFQQPTETIPKVPVDRISFREAIVNLIDNAIKFNKQDGHVTVSIRKEGTLIFIIISDTGLGIGKDHLATLFSPFNKGSMEKTLGYDRPGAGLGLYLTKLIIDAHKGKIEVDSKEGEGSTFTMRIPIQETPTLAPKG